MREPGDQLQKDRESRQEMCRDAKSWVVGENEMAKTHISLMGHDSWRDKDR